MQGTRLIPHLLHRARAARVGRDLHPVRAQADRRAVVGNFWTLQHAQLYTEPERLAASGYVTEEREEGGRRRRRYTITQEGRDALAAWRSAPTEDLAELRDHGLLKLFFGADAERPRARADRAAPRPSSPSTRRSARNDPGGGPRGPWLALRAGINAERGWIEYWEWVLKESDSWPVWTDRPLAARPAPGPARAKKQGLYRRPSIFRNSDFWKRAHVLRGAECGSSPMRGGSVADRRRRRARGPARPVARSGPVSQTTSADPSNGKRRIVGMPNCGSDRSCGRGPVGGHARAPIVRASTSAVTLATWWSPRATCSSTLCARRAGQRVVRHVVGVPVGVAAIPQHLDHREQERALEQVRVGRAEDGAVGVEVDAAVEQDRVVHPGHAEHGAGEVGRERRERAAEDAALAVAVVEQAAGVDHALALVLERGVRAEPVRVDHEAARGRAEVHEALLEPVGEAREEREVPEDARRRCRCPRPPCRSTASRRTEFVLVRHGLHVAGVHLGRRAEQAVPVERRAGRLDARRPPPPRAGCCR